MKKEDMSCIDCAVKNCNKMDKTYPDFCLTTHMDEEVLNEAMECYNEDENRKVTIAAAEVEYENYCKQGVGVNMCNPILQAKLLNRAKTDLNVVVGLCVGHDSLFYKYSEALTTTAVTKDRVLGHNPVAALYTADSYYSKLKKSEEE